jgi:Tfp pilus assembly protein PilF
MAQPRLPVGLMAVMLALVTIALYWPATRYAFVVLDDPANVSSNVHVQNGLTWEGIKWAFLNPVAYPGWQPLTMLSHMVVCQVFGLNPWGHHLANVLLHALNAGLVFALLQQMTGATWRSLLVAALFAAHPLRVEAVAWVTQRREVLTAFFGLLALIAYARYTEIQSLKSKVQSPKSVVRPPSAVLLRRTGGPWSLSHLPSPVFYLLSLCCFALGLMSKPTVVTWPFVMLLLDYWPLRRLEPSTLNSQLATMWRLVKEKIPFFVLAALMCVVTFVVQKREGLLGVGESLSLGAHLGNALISYCRYLGKLFWPTELAVFYPHPGQWPLGKVLLAGGVILGISVLVWVRGRRSPFLLVGWLWYCGTLVPMSQVIQTGSHAMADRWTYLPSLGVLILAIWGACELTRRWRYQVLALSVAGGAAIVLCLALTRHQLGYWKNSETILRHALAVTENNYHAHRNLGVVFYEKGQVDEAISQFQAAVRVRPYFPEAYDHLGIAFDKKGQLDEAIRQLQEAIRLDPDYTDAHYNLGVAFYQQGRTGEAIRQFQEAIRLEPDHAEAHNNLGTALGLKGQMDEAIRQFQEALRLKPDYADARRNLDVLLATKAHTSPPPGTATNR